MKKILIVIMAVLSLGGLVGCSSGEKNISETTENENVYAAHIRKMAANPAEYNTDKDNRSVEICFDRSIGYFSDYQKALGIQSYNYYEFTVKDNVTGLLMAVGFGTGLEAKTLTNAYNYGSLWLHLGGASTSTYSSVGYVSYNENHTAAAPWYVLAKKSSSSLESCKLYNGVTLSIDYEGDLTDLRSYWNEATKQALTYLKENYCQMYSNTGIDNDADAEYIFGNL